MRLALIVALAPDRRSGRVLSDLMTADQAIGKVKQAITSGECPDVDLPILVAVGIDTKLREHRFVPSAVQIAAQRAAGASPSEEIETIVVEIGEGDQKVFLNLLSEPEAKFVRELADSALRAGQEIERLRADAVKSAGQVATLEMSVATANGRVTTLEAELAAARAEIAKLKEPPAAAPAEGELLPGAQPAAGAKKKPGS